MSIAETKPGTVLSRIVEKRRAEVARRQRIMPEAVLRIAAGKADAPRDFAGALGRNQLNVIAEIKKASPSAGLLRQEFDAVSLARGFRAGRRCGAFGAHRGGEFPGRAGAFARRAQRRWGFRCCARISSWSAGRCGRRAPPNADSFLLIAAALDDAALADLLALGRELGMEPLVEVHTAAELERVLASGARIVGVNNRDLHTLEVRVETSLELAAMIPEDRIAVSESGLRSAEDLRKLRAAGFDAFLIGESFMREADPGAALRRLIEAADETPSGAISERG